MTSLRDPVTSKALRVRSRDLKKSGFIYINEENGLELSSVYKNSHDYIPELQTPLWAWTQNQQFGCQGLRQ